MTATPAVRAIVFDVFGTVVDWRGSIARDLGAWGAARGLQADWTALAERWRGRYQPQMQRVRSGELPWTRLDELHAESLRSLLPEFGLDALAGDAEAFAQLNTVWHRLDPWPDARPGLVRLRRRHILGPLSNGNVALLVNLSKRAALPWDAIFSAEHFERYKPDPATYLGVCRQLDLAPERVMLCAAHNDDLRAARGCGLATAFVARPTEYGPAQTKDLTADEAWDVVAADFEDLAARMGC